MYQFKNNHGLTRALGGFWEDILQNGFPNGWSEELQHARGGFAPVNVVENEKSYEVQLAAPGLNKEDFKIDLNDDTLTISFESKDEKKEQAGKVLRNEYRTRSFKRSFSLNDKVEAAQVGARYADGILYVSLPKKEITNSVQHITVD